MEEKNDKEFLDQIVDMTSSYKTLVRREEERYIYVGRDNLIINTLNYFQDFLNGDKTILTNENNRSKLELIKLYNDINSIINVVNKNDFELVLYISINKNELIKNTLDSISILSVILDNQFDYDITTNPLYNVVISKIYALENVTNKQFVKENN